MNHGFFGWIREGVKQSVLLGVHDAMQAMGSPEEQKNLPKTVSQWMATQPTHESAPDTANQLPDPARKSDRKRLGRSLKDLDLKPPAQS
jgi:hypothetical protein